MAEASHHSRFYQCIKKTGYLVKSPTSGKMGRWRKRWIMLVDSIVPCPNAGYERYARMEYYDVPENSRWCRDKTTKLSALKLKGVIDLRFCIAVQPSKNEKSKKFRFDIITGSSPAHHFAAESLHERDEWITALHEFLFTKKARTGPYPSMSRARSTHSTASSHSDLSLEYSYNHLPVHAMDDDFIRVKDSTQSVRKTSRDSIRRFLSANDVSIATSEHVMHIENPAQDIPSLQQQLALRYVPEIPPDNIRNSEVIGSGNFSLVSKGEWSTPSGPCMVAIKHASGNNATLRMLQEAVVMVQLWHPNIVNLLGLLEPQKSVHRLKHFNVSLKFYYDEVHERSNIVQHVVMNLYNIIIIASFLDPFLACSIERLVRMRLRQSKPQTTLVTEMCTQGNLIYLLRALRSRAVTLPDLPSFLLKYGEHILLGLNYLTEKGFVHRYLTAKHILVTDQGVCKISGFACSSLLSNEREFILDRDANVPVKWTAPEATMYWRFTPASMVWSFGVILYEIWSLGQEPYRQMTNLQIMDWLQEGHRLSPPSGCFRSIYEIMIACWHPDSEMRPEPSTILRHMLQLGGSQALYSLETHEIPRVARELGVDVSAGQYLHPDLQETYLRYANSAVNKDVISEGNIKKSTVSKQVNFDRRWSFSDDEEDSSGEEMNDYHRAEPLGSDDEYTYVREDSQLNSSAVSPIRVPIGGNGKLVDMRRALATNLDGRWSLSTRGSEPNFNMEESESLREDISAFRKHQPMSLPLQEYQGTHSHTPTPLTPRRIESDNFLYQSGGLSQNNTVATPIRIRWSEFDDDSDTEQIQSCYSAKSETKQFEGPLRFGALSDRNHLCSLDLSPSEVKMDISSEKYSPNAKVSRPKPPIKPRKKLPKITNTTSNQLQTFHSSPTDTTMTTSSSAPSLLPKAAPRKRLVRTASIDLYDHLENYESIDTCDQECLDKLLWASPSDKMVPAHYYNLPSTFSCSAVVHNTEEQTYDQVRRYEKIQTYETIPYHFNLTTKVPELQ